MYAIQTSNCGEKINSEDEKKWWWWVERHPSRSTTLTWSTSLCNVERLYPVTWGEVSLAKLTTILFQLYFEAKWWLAYVSLGSVKLPVGWGKCIVAKATKEEVHHKMLLATTFCYHGYRSSWWSWMVFTTSWRWDCITVHKVLLLTVLVRVWSSALD